jgi:2,4-dienoyl-CoA reductase (NADPH2)
MEAGSRLGGRFALAAATAEPNAELLAWFEGEMARGKIEIRLDKRVDVEEIVAAAYDEVVVATGARWGRPELPGADGARVQTVDDLGEWLEREAAPDSESGSSFVMIGGDRAGIALACVARARGAQVEVLEASEVFAASNGLVGRWRYVHDAKEGGIALRAGAHVRGIEEEGVRWLDREGVERFSPANRVIISGGAVPDPHFAEALVARGVRAHAIGDCRAVGLVEGAMETAAELMLSL